MLGSSTVNVGALTQHSTISHLQGRGSGSASMYDACINPYDVISSPVRETEGEFSQSPSPYVNYFGYSYGGGLRADLKCYRPENGYPHFVGYEAVNGKSDDGKWNPAPLYQPMMVGSAFAQFDNNVLERCLTVPALVDDVIRNDGKKAKVEEPSPERVYTNLAPSSGTRIDASRTTVHEQSPANHQSSPTYRSPTFDAYAPSAPYQGSPHNRYAYTSPQSSSLPPPSNTSPSSLVAASNAYVKSEHSGGPGSMYRWAHHHARHCGPFMHTQGPSHLGEASKWNADGKANCRVSLFNGDMWSKFHAHTNEMIITKHGRRMFPVLHFIISGLDPDKNYRVFVDMDLADNQHWKFQAGKWVSCGTAEPLCTEGRIYEHPDSPNTGSHWTKQDVTFSKLKLTNNKTCKLNQIILNSMHRYQPKIHVCEADDKGTELICHAFVDTQFIAVTAYQNTDITDLKVKFNPYARGMQDKNTSRLGFEQISPQQAAPFNQNVSPGNTTRTSPTTTPGLPVQYHHRPVVNTVVGNNIFQNSPDYQSLMAFQQRQQHKIGSFDIGHDSPESRNGYHHPTPSTVATPPLRGPHYAYTRGCEKPEAPAYSGGQPSSLHVNKSCSFSPNSDTVPTRTQHHSSQFYHSPPAPTPDAPSFLLSDYTASPDCMGTQNAQEKAHAAFGSPALFRSHFFHEPEADNDLGKDLYEHHCAQHDHPQNPFMASFLFQMPGCVSLADKESEASEVKDFGQLQEEAAKLSLDFLSTSPKKENKSRKRKLSQDEKGESRDLN